MSKPTNRSIPAWGIALMVTIVVWIFRGIPLTPFLPSGILWVLLLVTIGLLVFTLLQRTRY